MSMDYIGKIIKKYPHLKDDIEGVEDIFNVSKEILLNTIYPFDESRTEIPPRKEYWVYRCMVEIIERNGISSAVGYEENGIKITFDRSQISQSLMEELVPQIGAW